MLPLSALSVSDLDPALPELWHCLDRTAVTARLERLWRTIEGQRLAITRIERRHTTFEPGVRCVATWELSGERPGEPPLHTIGVVEVNPQGTVERLYRDDSALRGLAVATDADEMARRLAALPELTVPGPCACNVFPVRYKPGQSCVLRYELTTAPGELALYGKVTTAAAELFATLTAVHETSLGQVSMPRVAKPVAVLADLGLVLQEEVAGETLGARLFLPESDDRAAVELMQAAGSSVAAFNALVTAPGPRRTIEDDLGEIQGYEVLFDRLLPALAPRFAGVLDTIASISARLAEPAPVASHGALRTDQLLVGADGIVALDLDGFCWSAPARDAGNLLAYLDWRAIRRPSDAARIHAAARAFLAGYGSAGFAPGEPWLRLWRALSMLKIAGRRLRGLRLEEWPLLPRLLQAAADLVSG